MILPERVPPLLSGMDVMRVALSVLGLGIGLFVLVLFAYSVLVVFGFSGTAVISLPVLFALETLAVLGGIHFALLKRRSIGWRDLGWVPAPRMWLVLAGLGAIGFYVLLVAIQLLALRFFGRAPLQPLPNAAAMFPDSAVAFVASLAFGALAVPIAEEFLFRGILFRWLRDRWGVFVAAFASALAFAAMHPPAAGSAPIIFVIGLALAYLFARTGSLQPGMVLHGVNNAIGITWIYLTLWLGSD